MDKIICIGKNYLDHIKELGDKPTELPVLFLKPASVLVQVNQNGQADLPIPQDLGSLHFEVELVFRVSRNGYKIAKDKAHEYVNAVTIGLDMTLRDLQSKQKKNGHPWTTSKVFPGGAVIGPWRPLSEKVNIKDEHFSFAQNGIIKQQAKALDMCLSFYDCVWYASQFFELCEGDLLFSGTPAGVASVKIGDRGTLSFMDISYSVEWVKYV